MHVPKDMQRRPHAPALSEQPLAAQAIPRRSSQVEVPFGRGVGDEDVDGAGDGVGPGVGGGAGVFEGEVGAADSGDLGGAVEGEGSGRRGGRRERRGGGGGGGVDGEAEGAVLEVVDGAEGELVWGGGRRATVAWEAGPGVEVAVVVAADEHFVGVRKGV